MVHQKIWKKSHLLEYKLCPSLFSLAGIKDVGNSERKKNSRILFSLKPVIQLAVPTPLRVNSVIFLPSSGFLSPAAANTDYGHKMSKFLVLCSPHSNLNHK
jgi:hypothetical protein